MYVHLYIRYVLYIHENLQKRKYLFGKELSEVVELKYPNVHKLRSIQTGKNYLSIELTFKRNELNLLSMDHN